MWWNRRGGDMTWRGSALYETMRLMAREHPRPVEVADMPVVKCTGPHNPDSGVQAALSLLFKKGYVEKRLVGAHRGLAYVLTQEGLALWVCVADEKDRRIRRG